MTTTIERPIGRKIVHQYEQQLQNDWNKRENKLQQQMEHKSGKKEPGKT